jgi:hypothetical protein
MAKGAKRPRDTNQLAKLIADLSTGEATEVEAPPSNRRKGGVKGGAARAKALSPDDRSRIAAMAAQARWKKR